MAPANEPQAATSTGAVKTPCKASDPVKVDIIHIPADEDDLEGTHSVITDPSRTILHIYFEQDCHSKYITPVLSPLQERRFGPTPKQQKARRIAKTAARTLRETAPIPPSSPVPPAPTALQASPTQAQSFNDESYFLHTPYLSFHLPPSILYACPSSSPSKHSPSRPIALLHSGWFWRSYKIQLGRSLSLPGVVDPRGVVSWRHNGGPKDHLRRDEEEGGRLLRGYRVRGWRLWGETGKKYVHAIRDKRKAGMHFDDPDVEPSDVGQSERDGEKRPPRETIRADEVVHLSWTRPLSRQTRLYTFHFRGVEFQWKGTGAVSEGRKCGWMLRFCHLKLVAKIPMGACEEKKDGTSEVCLARYTSSIAAEKSGTLEVFDQAVLRFVEDWLPGLLDEAQEDCDDSEAKDRKITRLKKGMLYQLIVATVLCMAKAEKEKRHTLIDLIIGIAENAGNGGG